MATYRPFSPERLRQLTALLAAEAVSVDAFIQLRRALSGQALGLEGLRRLVAAEPTLACQLTERILPSLLRHARGLLLAGEPTLALHDTGHPAHTRMRRATVAGWLAHMVLGTLPPPAPDHPEINFAPLLCASWPAETAKLRCVLTYFDRIADAPPAGELQIERLVAPVPTAAQWAANAAPLPPLTVDTHGVIEDAVGCRQVDFANRYLGGGILSGGCVQEEIRFAAAPELLVGLIVSPYLRANEAIVLRGAERFALTRGYAQTLQHAGPFADPCPRAADGTPAIELVAIDAVDYRHVDPQTQFTAAVILRELGKASCGFWRDAPGLPIASGNWGCGAFGGDPPLKAVIQWLAAAAQGRALRYFSFGDPRVGDLAGFAAAVRQRGDTVGTLFQRLLAAPGQGGVSLYQRLLTA